ncbi:MAG: hypothetical protein C0603_06935 [Denitrovibrio sp.]|nr:MAG: hypothetical protein C0603_06935 [Denitrovibrio sp.]
METIIIILIGLQSVLVLSNLIGLPGGMISALIPVIMYFSGYIGTKLLISVLFIIAAGEVAEFYTSFVVGKRFGVSSKGLWASIIVAIVFGIIMSPLFFGLGAVIGTFLGAYLGALVYELASGTSMPRAKEKAKGVLFGRFLGTFAKLGAGFFAIYIEIGYLF